MQYKFELARRSARSVTISMRLVGETASHTLNSIVNDPGRGSLHRNGARPHYARTDKFANDCRIQLWWPRKYWILAEFGKWNSRRSILGATMGDLAAAYYGFDNIRFHSGGTIPSACNKRTVATLKEIGFQIEPTGKEAERGDSKTPNPI